MRSSDAEVPREADMANQAGLATALSQEEVEALIPHEPTWRYWLRRIDIPVQLLRIGILVLIWWLWWSEVLWNGWDAFSVFGVQPFPNVPETFRASPYETWQYFTEIYHEQLFWQDLWVTVKEALIGFALGSILGLLVGIVLGRFRRASRAVGPFVVIVNAMPKIAFLPLILIVYGVGEMSKVVLAVLIVFFIVQVPTQAAVALVDPDLDTGGPNDGRVPTAALHQGHICRASPRRCSARSGCRRSYRCWQWYSARSSRPAGASVSDSSPRPTSFPTATRSPSCSSWP